MGRLALVSALAVGLLSACKKDEQPPSGVGQWVLMSSTLEDGELRARCQPSGELTWCFGAPPIKIGDQPATVDLYFKGHDKSSKLVEIAMRVRACDREKVEPAFASAVGLPPTESSDKIRIWESPTSFIIMKLGVDGPSCDINFVHPSDAKRIAELKAGK